MILAGRVGDTSQLATYQTDLDSGLTPGFTRFGLVWLSILSVHPMLASLAMLSLAEHSMRQHMAGIVGSKFRPFLHRTRADIVGTSTNICVDEVLVMKF